MTARDSQLMNDLIRRQGGLTLVELMIAMLLTILLLGSVLLIHISGRATFLDAEQMSRIQENIRFASDYMIRDIRNAGFRDEAVLKAGHELQIEQAYATILNDGETLRIRYAGRGHCTESYDEFRLVENEYALNAQTGELTCRGRTIPRDDSGATQITDEDFSDAVGLVGGLTGLAFQLVCPDGGTVCDCDIATDLASACIGVRVGLQFQGLRDLNDGGNFENRSVELTAAFRNIILDRVNAVAEGEDEDEG